MKIGGILTSQLLSTKTGNIGLLVMGIYFCGINLLLTGTIDFVNMTVGLTFIAIAVMNAKPSPTVISGLLTGFLGLNTLLSITNVLPRDLAQIIALACAIGIFLFEFGGVKIGKSSKKAKVAIVIPIMALFFMFILAIAGVNPTLSVDWSTELMKFLNYIALMFLTGLMAFDLLGWRIAKKNHGLWVTALAVISVLTSFMGIYQGTLAW